MTKDERQSLILDLLMQQDSLLVTDLSEQLNVSSVTIRKERNSTATTVKQSS